jgi:hypothetical protein
MAGRCCYFNAARNPKGIQATWKVTPLNNPGHRLSANLAALPSNILIYENHILLYSRQKFLVLCCPDFLVHPL